MLAAMAAEAESCALLLAGCLLHVVADLVVDAARSGDDDIDGAVCLLEGFEVAC